VWRSWHVGAFSKNTDASLVLGPVRGTQFWCLTELEAPGQLDTPSILLFQLSNTFNTMRWIGRGSGRYSMSSQVHGLMTRQSLAASNSSNPVHDIPFPSFPVPHSRPQERFKRHSDDATQPSSSCWRARQHSRFEHRTGEHPAGPDFRLGTRAPPSPVRA
jgi:hypothetical protein